MEKYSKVSGSGGAKLAQVIGKYGYNRDTDIGLATVVSPPPNLTVFMHELGMELDAEDLVIAGSLVPRTVSVDISVDTSDNGSHTHSLTTGGTARSAGTHNHNVTITEINVVDELKEGDTLIVAYVEDSQLYVVLDKAVRLDGTDS